MTHPDNTSNTSNTGAGAAGGVSADLGAGRLIDLAGHRLRQRRLLEVEELQVLAAWADLHSCDGPGGLITPGGEGTPGIRDYAIGEIALARSAGVVSTINAIADVLDLRHRLPQTWKATQGGVSDMWVVRKIARMSRHLPLSKVWVLDTAIARPLGRQPAPRVLQIAEGKIIEADPDLHNQRVEEAQQQRYVRLHAADSHGLRTLIARLDAGDAAWVEATIVRVAQILARRHDDHTTQQLRAKAMGYLARPAELLALLAANTNPQGEVDLNLPHDPWTPHTTTSSSDDTTSSAGTTDDTDSSAGATSSAGTTAADGDTESTGRADDDAEPTANDDDHDADDDGYDIEPSDVEPVEAGLNRAVAFPAELLATMAEVDWTLLRPRHHLYVHLHHDVINGHTPGAARIEDTSLPPMTLAQLHGLLTGAHVTVKPVIDLNTHLRTDAYEHPETIKERVHLIHGGDYWPYATSTSRKLDYDHVTPFDHNGPGGQTGTHNSAPIGRRHHRYRTHAGYHVHQLPEPAGRPGSYVWTTPHGQTFITDHHGTRAIPTDVAHTLINAPPQPPDHDTGPPDPDPDDRTIPPDPETDNHPDHTTYLAYLEAG